MNRPYDNLILEYNERQLIRRALISIAYSDAVKGRDAETLKKLEHQLADAQAVVQKGVDKQ
jgi:3-methyladenine DNA glycosylase AlkD